MDSRSWKWRESIDEEGMWKERRRGRMEGAESGREERRVRKEVLGSGRRGGKE